MSISWLLAVDGGGLNRSLDNVPSEPHQKWDECQDDNLEKRAGIMWRCESWKVRLFVCGGSPLLRIMVLLPSVALKSPLQVASPLCATLYSTPSKASDAGDDFSYTKHRKRSSFDVAWLWCTLPTKYRELPSFHTARHCSSSTGKKIIRLFSWLVLDFQKDFVQELRISEESAEELLP